MTAEIVVEESGARRRYAAAELPLVVGGPDPDIRPVGVAGHEPLAYFGLDRDELFIQPAGNDASIFCNGSRVTTSQWLRAGDLIEVGRSQIEVGGGPGRFELAVRIETVDAPTEPPITSLGSPGPEPGRQGEIATIRPIEFHPRSLSASRRRRWALRPIMLVTWTALGALAAAAWFVLTARAVEIRVHPDPDRLEIGGVWMVELGGRYLLRPGVYRLTAERQGYRRLETTLQVSAEASQVHDFSLEQLPGVLQIVTRPASGAEIAIDGERIGVSPMPLIELAAGDHIVRIQADGYRTFEETVSIGGAGSQATLSVELAPLWAAVSFASSPSGAAVRVDDRDIGRTPLTSEILEGRRAVELRLQGYKSHRFWIDVVADRTASLPVVELAPLDGRLALSSEPPGATLSVDGRYRGQTPLEIELPPDVDHQLTLSKLGFRSRTERVRVQSGATRVMHAELEPELGEIEIRVQPSDAQLFVDGRSRGAADQILRLSSVPHEIEIRKPGFESFRRTITPRPGFPQVIRVTLRTEEEARIAERPEVIRSSQGHRLQLIQPGRFRMGASRREPGRRANETLREVELTRAYYLGETEVSNRQFREFLSAHRSGQAGSLSLDQDDYPVVRVGWEQAARYCNWLSERESLPPAYVESNGTLVGARPMTTGYRLPTEAEWVWAARYAGGREERKYPWGETLPVQAGSGNYADEAASGLVGDTLSGYRDGFAATAPVDSFEPNVLGIFNLGGNVAEWAHDLYTIHSGSTESLQRDPFGPADGTYHVIRGSSWMDATITELRWSFRDYGNTPRADVGFRISRYAD